MQFANRSNKSALLLAAALTALVAALALSSVAGAAASLSFGDTPTGWSVTSGEADGNVGKIQASGVKKNRIRYSISGASGFSIKAKQGVVVYDGSAISADRALIVVTATDRKGKASEATVTITVSVTQAQSETPLEQVPKAEPESEPHSAHPNNDIFHTPKYPTGLRAEPGSGQVTLSWNNPPERDRPIITKYQYQQDGGTWTDMVGSSSSTTSYKVEGLKNDVEYGFRIRAFNSDSIQSRSSSEVKVTPNLKITQVKLDCPGYPTPCEYKPIGYNPQPPSVYEGTKIKQPPLFRIGADHHDVTWTIDSTSEGYGFYLTGGVPGVKLTPNKGQYVFVEYDGTPWPGEGYGDGEPGNPPKYTHKIKVTGTHGTNSVTVEIEVCLTRPQ